MQPFGFGLSGGLPPRAQPDTESRLAAIEQTLQALVAALGGAPTSGWPTAGAPFITDAERPQLGSVVDDPTLNELRAQMESGSAQAKQAYDNLPPS